MTQQAVDALRAIHKEVRAVAASLSEEQWQAPSACEGWRVQDVFAHLTSNLKETVEPTPAPAEGAPELKAEEAMEALVAPRKDWTPRELMAEYDQYVDGWLGAMAAMQNEPTASTEAPLADLGTHQLHLVANAFAFDHYCHLRIDLADVAGPLSDADDLMVRPGIEWMLAGMPQMQVEQLKAAVESELVLDLTGPGGGQWTISPASGDGMISVTEGASAEAVSTISSSAHDFVSWGTKRSDWRDACEVTGDDVAAAAFLDTLDII